MNATFDQNSVIVTLAIGARRDLTAFSALPGAPVLPYAPRRRPLAAFARRARAFPRNGRRRSLATIQARPAAC